MLDAFAEYERRCASELAKHSVIGQPLGTRLRRIIREPDSWILWLDTKDFAHGTYLQMYDNGCVQRVTVREDEGDEIIVVRPSDETIRRQST